MNFMRFFFPPIDNFSFLLGLIFASLLWGIILLIRPTVKSWLADIRVKIEKKQNGIKHTSMVEEQYRQNVLLQAQRNHLAASLFSLDEIIEPPTLMAPPQYKEPGSPYFLEDIVSAAVPFLPSWPELASIYQAPTLPLLRVLSYSKAIVLTGPPGLGKTVTLAYIASRLAQRDLSLGLPPETLPFLFHIADFSLLITDKDPLDQILDCVVERSSPENISGFNNLVRTSFRQGTAFFLLDGLDELVPEELTKAFEFVKSIKKQYPKIHMMIVTSLDYYDGLVSRDFIPFALSAWTSIQRARFLERWGGLWEKSISNEAWAQNNDHVDPLLLKEWLRDLDPSHTPLDLTLLAWGAYAGDLNSKSSHEAIRSHINRLLSTEGLHEHLEVLAEHIIRNTIPIFGYEIVRESLAVSKHNLYSNKDKLIHTAETVQGNNIISFSNLVDILVNSGLLVQCGKKRLRFIHPVFSCFLAGKYLCTHEYEYLINQPTWIGKSLTLQFIAVTKDISLYVDGLLALPDRPLFHNLFSVAHWLRDSSTQSNWRGQALSRLVNLLCQKNQPLGLRGQALCALLQSNESSILLLFRKLLEDQNDDLRQLAVLGLGALRDSKAIEQLGSLINVQDIKTCQAVCLALVNIGVLSSMDIIANTLLHGDEDQRCAAAEALANNPEEGYALLKEGAHLKEDLLVRRACAYGLGRINENWVEELLKDLAFNDDQWAVRTAATEVNESRLQPFTHLPPHLPPASESPWLIEFAGKQGLGISPDKPPVDLLLLAFKSGSNEERMASLRYLQMIPSEKVFSAFYQELYGLNSELRESVFHSLSCMAASGISIPDPIQFGIDTE
jgi:hypothetical protein